VTQQLAQRPKARRESDIMSSHMYRQFAVTFAVALLPGVLAEGKVKVEKPKPQATKQLVSCDFLYGSAELAYDMYTAVWSQYVKDSTVLKLTVDQLVSKLPQDPITPVLGKVGVESETIMLNINKGKDASKKVIYGLSAQVYVHLSSAAGIAVVTFERIFPQHKGLIGKSPQDFALFVIYMGIVIYVLVKLVMLVLRWLLCIFRCLCCCGCCCCCGRRAKKDKVNGKKSPSKQSSASDRGKAAKSKK